MKYLITCGLISFSLLLKAQSRKFVVGLESGGKVIFVNARASNTGSSKVIGLVGFTPSLSYYLNGNTGVGISGGFEFDFKDNETKYRDRLEVGIFLKQYLPIRRNSSFTKTLIPFVESSFHATNYYHKDKQFFVVDALSSRQSRLAIGINVLMWRMLYLEGALACEFGIKPSNYFRQGVRLGLCYHF